MQWTDQEIQYLYDNYKSQSTGEIAEALGRTRQSIQRKVNRENLVKKPRWSEEETKFLKENYEKLDYPELREKLGRTKVAIQGKAGRMDLKKHIPYDEWIKGDYHRCSRCGEIKKTDEFGKRYNKKRFVCKECMRKAQKKRVKERREWIREQKKKPCDFCGQKYPPEVMDFHHLDKGEKRGNVGSMAYSKGKERIKKEIEKCVLLCANCHRIIENNGKDSKEAEDYLRSVQQSHSSPNKDCS